MLLAAPGRSTLRSRERIRSRRMLGAACAMSALCFFGGAQSFLDTLFPLIVRLAEAGSQVIDDVREQRAGLEQCQTLRDQRGYRLGAALADLAGRPVVQLFWERDAD